MAKQQGYLKAFMALVLVRKDGFIALTTSSRPTIPGLHRPQAAFHQGFVANWNADII
jgi:hypothetical protein